MTRGNARQWQWLLCAALSSTAALGCSRRDAAQEEQRRVLLTPPDNKREREEAARKKQIFDEDGDLIPSEQSVAGLLLPRGLTPTIVTGFPSTRICSPIACGSRPNFRCQ